MQSWSLYGHRQLLTWSIGGARGGGRSVLVATVSHFWELDADLEVLGSRRSTGLMEDEADALWSRVCVSLDSLASHVPSSVAHNPPGSTGGVVVVACVDDHFVFVQVCMIQIN
jgi:hypothetical protein